MGCSHSVDKKGAPNESYSDGQFCLPGATIRGLGRLLLHVAHAADSAQPAPFITASYEYLAGSNFCSGQNSSRTRVTELLSLSSAVRKADISKYFRLLPNLCAFFAMKAVFIITCPGSTTSRSCSVPCFSF